MTDHRIAPATRCEVCDHEGCPRDAWEHRPRSRWDDSDDPGPPCKGPPIDWYRAARQFQKLAASLEQRAFAAEREAERLRTGQTIEGDFVGRLDLERTALLGALAERAARAPAEALEWRARIEPLIATLRAELASTIVAHSPGYGGQHVGPRIDPRAVDLMRTWLDQINGTIPPWPIEEESARWRDVQPFLFGLRFARGTEGIRYAVGLLLAATAPDAARKEDGR